MGKYRCKGLLQEIFSSKTALLAGISLVIAIIVSGIIMAICGYNPLEAFSAIFMGAFGSQRAIAQTLTQATILIFTGLAFTFSKKAMLINLGIEGQLHLGAMAAAIVGAMDMGLPTIIHLPLALIAGILAVAIWCVCRVFKVKFGSNEVISTIMLNTIAINFTAFLANYSFKAEGSIAQTEKVIKTAMLPRIIPKYQLTIAFFIAVLACIFVKFFINKQLLVMK